MWARYIVKPKFLVKVYRADWTFKLTLSPEKYLDDMNWTSNINGWQWQFVLWLNESFDYSEVLQWDFLKIYQTREVTDCITWDESFTEWFIYTWQITKITRVLEQWKEFVQLTALWLIAVMNQVLYNRTGSPDLWYKFQENADAWLLARTAIDYLITKYPAWFSYTTASIPLVWAVSNFETDRKTVFQYMQNLADITNRWFFVDNNWLVTFQEKPTTPTHIIDFNNAVIRVKTDESIQDLKNFYLLTSDVKVDIYDDIVSILQYWSRETAESKTDILDIPTTDQAWQSFLDENADVKDSTRLIISNQFGIESIQPWDTITVTNTGSLQIQNLQVYKISYNPDQLEVELEKITSILDLIGNNQN